MNRYLIAAVSVLLNVTVAMPAWAADGTPSSPKATASPAAAKNLKGQIVKIEKDIYVLKDAAGKEVRLRVNQETVLQSGLHVGDMVDAELGPNGLALTLLRSLQ
jgi:hypothetical protein